MSENNSISHKSSHFYLTRNGRIIFGNLQNQLFSILASREPALRHGPADLRRRQKRTVAAPHNAQLVSYEHMFKI